MYSYLKLGTLSRTLHFRYWKGLVEFIIFESYPLCSKLDKVYIEGGITN